MCYNGEKLIGISLEKFLENFGNMPLEQLKVLDNGAKIIHDLVVFNKFLPSYIKEYNESKDIIANRLQEVLDEVDLDDKWSVDIMVEDGKWYLIDMGKMDNSALTEYMEEFKNGKR